MTLNKRIDRVTKLTKSGDKKAIAELELLSRIKTHLEEGKPVRTMDMTSEEREIIKDAFFLTDKKVIYVANVSESQLADKENDPNVLKVKEYAKNEGAEVITLCAKLEEDLSELEDNTRSSV